MRRIDTSTRAEDLFGPGKHGFKDGNPLTGDPATALDADWFNAIQEEMANVVEGAGLTLDPGDRSQLLQAIRRTNDAGAFGGSVSSALTITAADHGKIFSLLTNTFTVALPLLSTIPDGFRVTFHKGSAAGIQSVSTSGGAVFEGGETTIGLFVLGDVLDLVKHGSYWYPLVAPAQTSWPGLVRLASTGETAAGGETRCAVTPAGAQALLNAYGLGLNGSSATNPLLAMNADDALRSGIHMTDNGTVNLPPTASAAGLLLVMVRTAAGNPAAGQIYLDSSNRLFSRRRNTTTWGEWREVWSGVEAISLQTGSGYQRLPSGLILQWGPIAAQAGTLTTTFPMVFPADCLMVIVSGKHNLDGAHSIHVRTYTDTSVTTYSDLDRASGFIAIGA